MFETSVNYCKGNHKSKDIKPNYNSSCFSKNDHLLTKRETFTAILKYVPKNLTIWMPFYADGSCAEFLKEAGYKVIHEPKDFFQWQPENWDIILDNPPYSIKKKVIDRCLILDKPFILLLPLYTLRSKFIKVYKSVNVLILNPNHHFDYYIDGKRTESNKMCSNPIMPTWMCFKYNLPSQLTIE